MDLRCLGEVLRCLGSCEQGRGSSGCRESLLEACGGENEGGRARGRLGKRVQAGQSKT